MSDPIEKIEWRDAETLNGNDYNPNMVLTPELKLLAHSIMTNGWIQPVLINAQGIIIDGFHRWRLSQDSPQVRKKYKGKVPCVVLDITEPEAMLLTVRINRAKGVHSAVRMAELVKTLIDHHGLSEQDVAQGIGASKAEIDLLYQEGVFKNKDIKNYKYSNAWIPRDTKSDKANASRL